nr:sialate O-acetylesterase [uncultured Carboxylicivirga sp.]
MRVINIFMLILFQSLICIACSEGENVSKPAPVFKSSFPEDNAKDVELSTEIIVQFNEVVKLSSEHEITINNQVADVEESYTKLIVKAKLENNSTYNISIPAGAVKNTAGIELNEDIEFSFSTKEETVHVKDPNFHIYICFGQSNMEGQGTIEAQDKAVDERFQVLQALDCSELGNKGEWRVAVPPLCQCSSGLSPADYFGRTLIDNLTDDVKVGVINVAIGGCDIRLFDKDIYQDYTNTYTESWFQDKIKAYDGNPYQYLIQLAKLAQQDGVIKGILLHQGETNTGDDQWPLYVKKIYEDMLNDLSISADEVPLLAGEVFAGEDNCCSSMNEIINTLPKYVPTAHIVSSEECSGQDNAHFDSAGYRKLGKRYAEIMLSLLGIE